MKLFAKMILPLAVCLTLVASACDDKKEKDEHKDCGCPLAGAMVEAGAEMMDAGMEDAGAQAGDEVEAGQEAGQEEGGQEPEGGAEEGGDQGGDEPACEGGCEGEDCDC